MPEPRIDENIIETAAEYATKDVTLTKADLQAGKNMLEMDPLYKKFVTYQARIRDREKGEADLEVMYEREYNMSDGLYAELERRLNLEEEDEPDAEAEISGASGGMPYPGEALMNEAFREYLASDLWDGEHGEAVSFTEFLASREWHASGQEQEEEPNGRPEAEGREDFEDIENDVQDVSGTGHAAEEYAAADEDDFKEFEDDFGGDYDEFEEQYVHDEEMPDEEFDVPDEFDLPDGIEDVDIDLEEANAAEDGPEYGQDILPEDQEDFPELADDAVAPDEPEEYEGLEESVAEYDDMLDGDGIQEAQLIAKDAPQAEFVKHESFQPHDILDEASLGMSLASGVVEIEETHADQPDVPQKQPDAQLQALYARQAAMDQQEEQEERSGPEF